MDHTPDRTGLGSRDRPRISCRPGLTDSAERADITSRCCGSTDRCSQFHHGFVQGPRLVRGGDESSRRLPRRGDEIRIISRPIDRSEPGDHSDHIAVDDRFRPPENDRCDGTGGVSPDSGQIQQRRRVVRNLPAVNLHQSHRRREEQTCPSVVPKALPGGQNLVLPRLDHRCRGRKAVQKSFEAFGHPTDLRLLEHQFADQSPPGGSIVPPGQFSSLQIEPGE